MDASCGPSNAVSQLAKHSQRDQTLQRERFNAPIDAPAAFRSHGGIDGQLNRDFHQFNQSEIGNQFQGQFQDHHQGLQNQGLQNQGLQNQGLQNSFSEQFQNSQRLHAKDTWVQDFGGMSLQQNPQKSGMQPQKSGWQSQFMQMQNQGQHHRMAGRPMAPVHGFSAMQRGNVQQQDAVHIDEQSLEAQFDQIEQEMSEVEPVQAAPVAQQHVQTDAQAGRSDNEQFAEAARQVQDSMSKGQASEETAAKFQQSNFLKLMTSISDRQVELSSEGDKLVTKTGEDIREHMSDPLRHEKEAEPSYHKPMHDTRDEPYPPLHGDVDILRHRPAEERPSESESVRSHLPDPLAHIKDGQLSGDLSSLQTAQVISGGQVQAESWMEDGSWEVPARRGNSILSPADQELFDDYRNDDDHF